MQITRKSQITGEVHTRDIPVTQAQLHKWNNGRGEYIQNAMPNLPSEWREFLMTGITPEEWKEHIEGW